MNGTVSSPAGERLHIGFFGKMNSGKSSLINAFVHQQVSIVSDTPGTTTDAVHKAMEIHGIGAVTLLDTAGIDDSGVLGKQRVQASIKAAEECDIAIVLFSGQDDDYSLESQWCERLLAKGTSVIGVISKADLVSSQQLAKKCSFVSSLGIPCVTVSSLTKNGISSLREALVRAAGDLNAPRSITGSLVQAGDVVMLVMPQDPQAPKGRLIQPEAQTIRSLLEKHCIIVSCALEELDSSIASLKNPPALIITDSQAYRYVYDHLPAGTRLTSFSVLFAAYKGDISYYVESAKAIDDLPADGHVLIAEICSHVPMQEDIGRIQIPRLIMKRRGEGIRVDICSGADFPQDLSSYDLIIQCGGCMFNRAHILSRIARAKQAGVPMTNYGIAIAYMNGILDHVVYPLDTDPVIR